MTGPDQTKARLLEAAGEEFAEKGFEGATVRSICARAGANLAAVNYHFGDKEQLYAQAVIAAHRCGVKLPTEAEFRQGTPGEQLRRYIRDFLSNILAVDGDKGWHHTLMLRELLRPTRASETLVREVIRPKFERLIWILDGVCPEADERRRHALAFSIIGQCLHYRLGRPIAARLIGDEEFRALDLDYLTDHITDFSLAALGLAPPLDARGETSVGSPVQAGREAS
jgi:TetR/AcrR family transcriptional regulator, regulator of cefoperazone and chloramphenicol sensitivity